MNLQTFHLAYSCCSISHNVHLLYSTHSARLKHYPSISFHTCSSFSKLAGMHWVKSSRVKHAGQVGKSITNTDQQTKQVTPTFTPESSFEFPVHLTHISAPRGNPHKHKREQAKSTEKGTGHGGQTWLGSNPGSFLLQVNSADVTFLF